MLQADRKITPDQYRRNVIWPMLALKKLASEKIEVTDDDMKRAFIRDYGEKVRARMIVLDNMPRPGSPEARRRASGRLRQPGPKILGRAQYQVTQRRHPAHSPLRRQRDAGERSLQAEAG